MSLDPLLRLNELLSKTVLLYNVIKNPMEVMDEIEVLSWRWGLFSKRLPNCPFYEWSWDLRNCLVR